MGMGKDDGGEGKNAEDGRCEDECDEDVVDLTSDPPPRNGDLSPDVEDLPSDPPPRGQRTSTSDSDIGQSSGSEIEDLPSDPPPPWGLPRRGVLSPWGPCGSTLEAFEKVWGSFSRVQASIFQHCCALASMIFAKASNG